MKKTLLLFALAVLTFSQSLFAMEDIGGGKDLTPQELAQLPSVTAAQVHSFSKVVQAAQQTNNFKAIVDAADMDANHRNVARVLAAGQNTTVEGFSISAYLISVAKEVSRSLSISSHSCPTGDPEMHGRDCAIQKAISGK